MEFVEIVIFCFCVIVFITLIVIGCVNKEAEKEAEEKAKVSEQEEKKKYITNYIKWWVASKYNKFEVVDCYTALISKEDRYHQVIRQCCTDMYMDSSVGVSNYYKFKEGDIISFEHAYYYFCLKDGSLDEFNRLNSCNLSLSILDLSDYEQY